jgi:hypothetical protein
MSTATLQDELANLFGFVVVAFCFVSIILNNTMRKP